MRQRLPRVFVISVIVLLATSLPGHVQPARAAGYTLESSAAYEIRPTDGEIGVSVELTFTNTTPDPAGHFSVFDELEIAIHDQATEVTASDDEGELEVSVAKQSDVNVATVALREGIRYKSLATIEVSYTLPDSESAQLRVRPSVVVFPVWSFGTSGDVSVLIPSGYEMRVDGDALTATGDRLTSGPIENPAAWLARVTAVRPAEYATFESTVPLDGGTADLLVRSFSDDEAWGTRTLDQVERALPKIEAAAGLPYPLLGQLIVTEAVVADTSGFGESASTGTEITVAFDQPPFTALHQVAHIWISPTLVESRWVREGLASEIAGEVASEMEINAPYDPAAEAERLAEHAVALDSWGSSTDVDVEAWGYAASWAFMRAVKAAAGDEAIRAVLARVAGSVGPYDTGQIAPEPSGDGAPPTTPLTTRSFLDQLEAVADVDLTPLFRDRALGAADVSLLEPRAAARTAFDELVAAAGGWDAPDPVRAAMTDWNFEDATALIAAAAAWLDLRDDLLAAMERTGLKAPDRLQQAYRAYGGGAEAVSELQSERDVVDAYAAAAESVNGQRSFLERLGLVGGADPQAELGLANGRFADGDLRGSVESISEAERLIAAAETAGVVRLVSLAVVVLILAGLAVVLFRRRASYTAAP